MDAMTGDSEVKRDRARTEKVLYDLCGSRIYLGRSAFGRLRKAVKEAMKDKATMSANDIVRLKELKPLNLIDRSGSCGWSQMFVIQALAPLVEDGTFLDMDISDKPWYSHAY